MLSYIVGSVLFVIVLLLVSAGIHDRRNKRGLSRSEFDIRWNEIIVKSGDSIADALGEALGLLLKAIGLPNRTLPNLPEYIKKDSAAFVEPDMLEKTVALQSKLQETSASIPKKIGDNALEVVRKNIERRVS